MAGRKKKSAGRMPLWLYVLIVVAIALVTYFRTSGEPEGADPQPPAASAAAQQTPADETLTVRFLDVGRATASCSPAGTRPCSSTAARSRRGSSSSPA